MVGREGQYASGLPSAGRIDAVLPAAGRGLPARDFHRDDVECRNDRPARLQGGFRIVRQNGDAEPAHHIGLGEIDTVALRTSVMGLRGFGRCGEPDDEHDHAGEEVHRRERQGGAGGKAQREHRNAGQDGDHDHGGGEDRPDAALQHRGECGAASAAAAATPATRYHGRPSWVSIPPSPSPRRNDTPAARLRPHLVWVCCEVGDIVDQR
jgi:hypothetical protein